MLLIISIDFIVTCSYSFAFKFVGAIPSISPVFQDDTFSTCIVFYPTFAYFDKIVYGFICFFPLIIKFPVFANVFLEISILLSIVKSP
jgi:hypothetical protein